MDVELFNLKTQYGEIRDEVLAALRDVLDSSEFILGPQVEAFEQQFAAWCGASYAIGVANGTDALVLALRALDLDPGAEVLVPTSSYVATAEAVVHSGAVPVFVDVEPETLTIDVEAAAAAVTPRTGAILPVHLYGLPARMDAILEFASQADVRVVEDASQAHGAEFSGKRVGGFGDAGCFSFYPSKNLGAYGDAGGVVTSDDELAERLRRLRHHGGLGRHDHEIVGYNSRLDTMQAAILLIKLGQVDHWNERRRLNAARYSERLKDVSGIETPVDVNGSTPVFHLYVVRVPSDRRDDLQAFLRSRGVATGVYYPRPLHLLPAFSSLGHGNGDFPVSEAAAAQVLALPMYPELAADQIDYVVDQLQEFFKT